MQAHLGMHETHIVNTCKCESKLLEYLSVTLRKMAKEPFKDVIKHISRAFQIIVSVVYFDNIFRRNPFQLPWNR